MLTLLDMKDKGQTQIFSFCGFVYFFGVLFLPRFLPEQGCLRCYQPVGWIAVEPPPPPVFVHPPPPCAGESPSFFRLSRLFSVLFFFKYIFPFQPFFEPTPHPCSRGDARILSLSSASPLRLSTLIHLPYPYVASKGFGPRPQVSLSVSPLWRYFRD